MELKDYEIERKGRLSLSYKTFFNKKANKDDIEICMWDKRFKYRWTIASFDYYEKEMCYQLISCCDRLNDEDINWSDFGILVQAGYKHLGDYDNEKMEN